MAASPSLYSARAPRKDCPICGARPRVLPGDCPDAWLCPTCNHTFISELPSDTKLTQMYESYVYETVDAEDLPAFLDDILLELIGSFASYRTNGKLVDVGFGHGGLLRMARKQGWDTHGVELSAAAVRAGNRLGLGTLHEGDFRTVPLEEGSFDVVVMSEVIEHLPEPMSFLHRAARLLRPGGLLYMTTPHGRGLSALALRASWSVLCPPDHLQLFSIESMRRCLVEAGFSKPGVYTQGLLPHELVAKMRARWLPRRAVSAATPDRTLDHEFEGRLESSYSLNAALMSGRVGRSAKRTANAMLRVTTLGDSLRVRAVR